MCYPPKTKRHGGMHSSGGGHVRRMGASVVLWRSTVEDHHDNDVGADSDGALDAETRGGDPENGESASRSGWQTSGRTAEGKATLPEAG